MKGIRFALVGFCVLLGLLIYAADAGMGSEYLGRLRAVPLGDKIGHAVLMFTLCTLVNLAMGCRPSRWARLPWLLGTAVVAMLVTGEEFSQIWIPGRSFDLFDLAADAVGIAAGDVAARRLLPMLVARRRAHRDAAA